MALQILKALKKTPSVKFMIHKELAGWEKARNDGKVHASDLMKDLEFCPREWALRKITGIVPKDQFIGTALRITFHQGKDVEYRIRNEWLRPHAVGMWQCRTCGNYHPTFGKYPKVKCQKCAYSHWEYTETNFVSPETGVTGGIDLVLDVQEPKHRIIELKIMSPDTFKDLKAPLAEHKARTSLYMRLAEESHLDDSNKINTNEAHILYVSRSFGFKDETLKAAGIMDSAFSPFKEFVVQRDDSLTETVLARAKVVKLFREDPTSGMPCGICANGLGKRAQQCSAVKPCWSGQHPQLVTWLEGGEVKHPGKKLIGS